MKTGPRIYNLFPTLVGSIERWAEHLPRIAAMGFDWLYVNPFHLPGYSGSLYAVKDYYRLNPLFRDGSGKSDDELLARFVEEARGAGIAVMMDLVVNHTARDAVLAQEHPEWYRHEPDGTIASPFAIDPGDPGKKTVWSDLAELDYEHHAPELVAYFSAVARRYAQLGFRGFRCDAAYKLPGTAWAPLIAAVREVLPGALFAAETLGGPLDAIAQLRLAGFDYLFNSSKWWDFSSSWLLDQYEEFRHIAPSIAFPESHDTPRLVAELAGRTPAEIEAEYRFRYLFAAFFSSGVMLPIGYEYGFARALDVVLTRPEHWEAPRFDLSAFIADANTMKRALPALNEEGAERRLVDAPPALALLRAAETTPAYACALINPDEKRDAAIATEPIVRALDGAALRDVTPQAPARTLGAGALVLRPLEIRVFAAEPPHRNGAADPRANARPVVIEHVWPEIDAGRFPVKRIAGDRLVVEADVFREGHDLVAAVLRYRLAGGEWRETPMLPRDDDRRRGTFPLERNARYEYTIEAWPDAFGTWRRDVARKREAGQTIDLELVEGRALVEEAPARARPDDRIRLESALRELDALGDPQARAEALLSESLAAVMQRAADRSCATSYPRTLGVVVDRRTAQTGAWYEMFPRSQGTVPGVASTFAQAERRLADVAAMGFDVLYLPPIHPIGRSFRKGKNNALEAGPGDPGSPWAIGSAEGGHTAVDPALGTLADFEHFVAAARAHGLEIALDYALQCSPDHPYVREHPEWFTFRPDGSIKYAENPPKKYQDIVNFNWFGPHAPALWDELRDVVEFWVARGVKIFRVDNPHTKPFPFWEWMIADVQSRHPEVIFLAEAFTRPKVMKELAKLGFSQSYTYFTWRNFKGELIEYLDELARSEMAEYYRPNFFTNTPDILPPFLQSGGRPAFRIRLILAATLSSAYGIYSGFELCEADALPGREEYANSEKYEIKVRDWDAPGNIKDDVARLNRIRRENPALHDWRNVRFCRVDDDDVLFYAKSSGENVLLVAVVLDPFAPHEARLHLPMRELGLEPGDTLECEELLTGERLFVRGPAHAVRLDPATRPAVIYRTSVRMNVDYESPSD